MLSTTELLEKYYHLASGREFTTSEFNADARGASLLPADREDFPNKPEVEYVLIDLESNSKNVDLSISFLSKEEARSILELVYELTFEEVDRLTSR